MFDFRIAFCSSLWYTLSDKLNILAKCLLCCMGAEGEKGIGCESRTVNSRCVPPNAFVSADESQSLGNREGRTHNARSLCSGGGESEDLL